MCVEDRRLLFLNHMQRCKRRHQESPLHVHKQTLKHMDPMTCSHYDAQHETPPATSREKVYSGRENLTLSPLRLPGVSMPNAETHLDFHFLQ